MKIRVIPGEYSEKVAKDMSNFIDIPCIPLNSYLAITLSPSNPTMHPSRLYELFHDYVEGEHIYERNPYFYEEWGLSLIHISLTTVAGFLALCIMELGFGKDIGFVMAKGVVFGVICTITVLPAMILTFDKLIYKYKHKTLLPKFEKSSAFVIKHHKILVIIGAIILIPAIIGNNNTEVYYNLDESLPKDLPSIVANNK